MTIYEATKQLYTRMPCPKYITQYIYRTKADFETGWALARGVLSDEQKWITKDDDDLSIVTFSNSFDAFTYIHHDADRIIKQLMPIECERLWRIIKEEIDQDSDRTHNLKSELMSIGLLLTGNSLEVYDTPFDTLMNVARQAFTRLQNTLNAYDKEND